MSGKIRIEALKDSMIKTPQEKIQEIVDECSKGNYIFRGEKKQHPQVSSGLYRQYCQPDNDNSDNGSNPIINNEHFSVFSVEKDIVEKVKRHLRSDAPNVEVLTELRHYGGKTALVDFSKDIHIALFFACDGSFDKDGRVILFETSTFSEKTDIDYDNLDKNQGENIYTLISPTGKSPRVIFQSSVFVHTSKGYLEEDRYKIIKIEKNIKQPLLEYLNKHFNIKTDTIYNDIQGFIQNQKDYSNAYIEFYRGHSNHQAGIFEEAIKNYSKAIELSPELIEAYTNRGTAKNDLGQYEEAIKDYDRAIEINPQFSEAYNNREVANAALGKHKEAIQGYDRAIEINPQYDEAYYNRGNAHSALGNHKEAMKDYDKAIGINPQYAQAYNNRGNARSALGQYDEAMKDYDKAIKLNPQYANAYNNRGNARSALGQNKEAMKDYDKAIELNPQGTEASYNRGNANVDLGQHEEAIQDYTEAKKLYEKNGDMAKAEKCEQQITRLKKLIADNDDKNH